MIQCPSWLTGAGWCWGHHPALLPKAGSLSPHLTQHQDHSEMPPTAAPSLQPRCKAPKATGAIHRLLPPAATCHVEPQMQRRWPAWHLGMPCHGLRTQREGFREEEKGRRRQAGNKSSSQLRGAASAAAGQ